MVKKVFVFLLLSKFAFAFNEAQVMVVEAPLFAVPDSKTKVVQYLKKGDKIRLHPAEINKDPYQTNMNLDVDLADQKLAEIQKAERDPLFKETPPYQPDRKSKFYKTSDKLGNDAWVLKEHVYVLYQDMREFEQKVIKPDPTDYVLAEPLPKNYPLRPADSYRSSFNYGMGPNTRVSYPYSFRVDDQGYDADRSVDITWVKMVNWDQEQKTFFGINFGVQTGKSTYAFDGGLATEEFSLISFGPRLEYDVWRNHQFRINLNGSLQATLMDEIKINIDSFKDNSLDDQRIFNSFQIIPTIGANLQRENLIGSTDLLVGFNIHFHGSNKYQSSGKGQKTWWPEDEYQVPMHVGMLLFVGIQASN